jgi:hypothetical protein
MAAEPSNKPAHDQLESLIDGLIRDILNEAEAPAPSGRGRASTLMETAMAEALAPRIVTVLERTMPSQPAGQCPMKNPP